MAAESKLGTAQVAIRADLKELDKDLQAAREKVEKKLTPAQEKIAHLMGNVIKKGAMAATASVVALGGAMLKLAVDAAPLEGIQRAFEGITTDADAMLSALREGSQGMVRDTDLMKSYNSAAQLVSKTFADQLPDAMGYLSKVAAATGQDMGYMIDSLVRGVGRLSPMILDNLGIQVNLTEANEAYAKSIGKAADELTKAEQQEAIRIMTMEKLAANTAKMPEVVGTAAQQWAAFRVTLENFKDKAGLALLPVLTGLLGILSPIVENLTTAAIPAFERIGEVISNLVSYFAFAISEGDVLNDFLASLPEPIQGVVQTIAELALWLRENLPAAISSARSALERVIGIVRTNIVPILAGLATLIFTVVIPALTAWAAAHWAVAAPILTSMAPIIVTLAQVAAAVYILKQIWERDWMGIRTAITEAWETKIRPALDELRAWLAENIPQAIEKLRSFWDDTLKPALQRLWAEINENIIPILRDLAEWFGDRVVAAAEKLSDFWTDTLKPALEKLWQFIQDSLIPILSDLASKAFQGVLDLLEDINNFWNDSFKPFLEGLWGKLQEVWLMVQDNVGPILEWLKDTIITPLATGIEAVKDAVDWFVGKLGELWTAISNFNVSSIMSILRLFLPGSPPPLAEGMLMVSMAADDMADSFANLRGPIAGLEDLLASFRGVLGELSVELPEVKVTVTEFFNRMRDLMWQAGAYLYDVEGGQGQWLTHLVEWFDTWCRPLFDKWAAVIAPLQPLLDIARGLMDLLADEARDAKVAVERLFTVLLDVMWAAGSYLYDAEGGQGQWLQRMIEWFGEWCTPLFEQWAAVMAPLQPLLQLARGLMDLVADEAKDAGTAASTLMSRLVGIMEDAGDYIDEADWLSDFIAWFKAKTFDILTAWAEAVQPLQPLVQLARGLTDLVAEELLDAKAAVSAMFSAVIAIMEDAGDYVDGAEGLSDFIDWFKEKTFDIFTKWSAALQPLQPLLSVVQGILEIAAKEVGEVKLDVALFFDMVIELADDIADYVEANKDAIDAVIAKLEEQKDRLTAFKDALKPLGDLMSEMSKVVDSAFKLAEGQVEQAFNQRLIPSIRNLRLGLSNLYDELTAMDVSWLPDLRTRVQDLQQVLLDVLGIIVSMIGAKEQEGAEATIITEFTEALRRGLENARDYFEQFYEYFNVTFRAQIATLDLSQDVATFIRTITDKLAELEPAVYSGGYSIGVQIGQGITDGLNAMIIVVEGVAKTLAQAALAAARRELGITSPSMVAAREVGEPFGLGVLAGIDRIVNEMGGMLTGSMDRLVAQAALAGPAGAGPRYTIEAHYKRYESERSLRDTVRLLEYGGG